MVLVVLRSELQGHGELKLVKSTGPTSTWSSRLTTSANERIATFARFVASCLPEALTLPVLKKVNCARCFKEKPYLNKLTWYGQMIKAHVALASPASFLVA